MASNLYRCAHCHKVVKRGSDRAWVESYCFETERYVHLMRVEQADLPLLAIIQPEAEQHD